MAATALASRLTAQQRQLQLALRALTTQDVIQVWRLLDPTAVGSTWPGVETALARIVAARRTQSALLAARYISAFRAAELGGGALAPALPPVPVDDAALSVSLEVTGRATLERLAPAGAPDTVAARASRVALTRVIGSVNRHVLDGGRAMLTGTVKADPRALGWARNASGSACAFCAMLAGRGPTYRSEKTASFKAHDNCACVIEPVYRQDAAWPPNAKRYSDLWDQATEGLSGKKALNAFRQALAS